MRKILSTILAALLFAAQASAQNVRINEGPSFGEITIGSTIVGSGTATRILFVGTGPVLADSALFTVDTTNKLLTVGLTSGGTSTGVVLGYLGSSGNAGIWPSTASAFNNTTAALYMNTTQTVLNVAAGGTIYHIIGDSAVKYTQVATAGAGPSITAGPATTDVAALSLTRTNNDAAVATGVKWTFTDTSSAAGFLPFQILCGSAATTNCLSVPKEGGIAFTAKAISKTAPTIASGFGTDPSIPANNGTAAFTVNVGTGGSASAGVVTMPAATTGWDCKVDYTGTPQAAARTLSAPTSATSITLTNYTIATAGALAWTAGQVLNVSCLGY